VNVVRFRVLNQRKVKVTELFHRLSHPTPNVASRFEVLPETWIHNNPRLAGVVPKHNITCLHGPPQRRTQHKINMLVNHLESALFGLFPSQLSYLRIHVVKIEPFAKPLRFNVVVSRAILLLDVGPDDIKISFSMPYKVKHCLN
jgi:hypothetical protein